MSEPKATSGGSTHGESNRASQKVVTVGDRKLFYVEVRPGETTYVSWKKFMKEACKVNGSSTSVPEPPPSANPNLECLVPGHPAENEKVDQPNRFSAVIEKIERLYMGKDSSDGEELDSSPDDDEYDTEDSFIDDAELDEYFEVDNSAVKHDGFFVNRGKLERISEPSATSNQQLKKRRRKESAKPGGGVTDVPNKQAKVAKMARGKDRSKHSGQSSKKRSNDPKAAQDSFSSFRVQSVNASLPLEDTKYSDKTNHELKNAASRKAKEVGSSDAFPQKCRSKIAHQQSNAMPVKSPHNHVAEAACTKKEKNDMHDLANATGSRHSIQKARPFSAQKKDSSNVRPKTSLLDKAIRELEKVVADSRPENQEADTTSQGVKRRLPKEVKAKLDKVARIVAKEGKLSAELINRLMSIVGHLIQLRSLKRNLKIMIDESLSFNRKRDDRFQGIKKEVAEMIKTQVPLMESQTDEQQAAGTSSDFHDDAAVEKAPLKKKFVMDARLEDKICDLYDIFVDGLDEDAGPQIRKLYVELAELWPDRLMDNHGIKRAICRAKERRRASYNMENMKKMKQQSVQISVPAVGSGIATVDPSASPGLPDSSMPDASHDRTKQEPEKLRVSTSSSNPTEEETKAVKRKAAPKSEAVREEYRPSREKQLILALPPPQTQTTLDLNQSS
ncbi:PREDICTED: ubinuclein-1-like isoform X3 [Tarenaya hassleriana]|uniref:ubinuclein-1-like isoform X3 n=1 Tax=Tarenaya hassleriana TaxID=28532 RepID=UPI00053C9D22|nr:PREDICTED: ubinuclein-1-like isoform X3 [Tarenaya hassleriana]